MTATFQCITVNDLSEFAFVAGTEQQLIFSVYDTTGSPIDLSTATLQWTMSPYGQPNTSVLLKSATVDPIDNYKMNVILL